MCGIVGMIQLDGKAPDAALLHAMGDRIAHRGPDDLGTFVDGAVGLHHRRLSIIDLATGHQPMTAGEVTVAFNGEIYNYLELRATLRGRGHEFTTASDTEVLLHAYLEHGLDFVHQLNGMFACLIYDGARRRVVVARDHFGIKPLYYHRGPRCLLYASEIKALLAHPSVRAQVAAPALEDYVTFQFTLGDSTLFRDVHKVEPAHLHVFDLATQELTVRRYWEPDYASRAAGKEAELVDELRSLLDDSVRLQMRSDVPVGTYLSGGLDSSAVTMLAARHAGEPLHTFTGAFDLGPQYDESRYARIVAAAAGATDTVVYATESEFVDLLPKLVWHMDEPAAGPGLFPQYVVAREARKHVKVCLGGQGADEIYAGYARYSIAYLEQALKAAINGTSEEGAAAIPLEDVSRTLSGLKDYQPLLQRFFSAGLFDPVERRYFRLIDRTEGALSLYSSDFLGQYGREAVFDRYAAVFNRPQTPSYFDRMTYFDMMTSLPALLQVEDRVSMAVSLESRVPLLDYRMVELMARIPAPVKFRSAEVKYLFKQVVGAYVPPQILARKDKMGFPVPLQQWARGKARDFFHDTLLSRACRERGLYDMRAVAQLLEHDAAYGRALWGLLQLELWHQQYIDKAAALAA